MKSSLGFVLIVLLQILSCSVQAQLAEQPGMVMLQPHGQLPLMLEPNPVERVAQKAKNTFSEPVRVATLSGAKSSLVSDSNAPSLPSKNGIETKIIKGRVVVPANSYSGVNMSSTPFAPEGTIRRALPAPLDPVFPSTEYIGVASQSQIGVPDLDPVYPLEKALYKACPLLRKQRIKVYGWVNPGMDYSSSHHSNIPLSYSIVPRRLELDQLILRAERVPDTVQNEHGDWGFRATILYGIDYRWTTSEGWYPASGELLQHNKLYGMDPVELYGSYYYPKVAKGMIVKVGRYISLPDIEAQLAPDNYLWTHSQMFTDDCYTQTGVMASIKLNNSWMVQTGVCAGSDIAPWAKAAVPTGVAMLRWQQKNNQNMVYGGVNSINSGYYRQYGQHDNLQQFNLTWFHRFNKRFHVATELYYLYSINALRGGTVDTGAPAPYNLLTGAGSMIPGLSNAWGATSYWNTKITDRDYITVRPIDYLVDPNGWRTGFNTTYSTWTVGWIHHFNNLLLIRPEIRYDRSFGHVDPYDNGTRRYQFTFGADLIQRF